MLAPLLMPKWGIDMAEGRVAQWLVATGAAVSAGAEVVEVESEKTAGVVEAPAAGVLRRQVTGAGTLVPVGGLLGVIGPAAASDAEIEAFVAGFAPAAAGSADDGPREQLVSIGGCRLRVQDRGAGEPAVLLLHGFGGDLRGWGAVQAALARTRRVISVDLPAHGGSGSELPAADPSFFHELVLGLLQALGVGRVHLVGHSWGGDIAWGVASRAPERVASLTLLGTAGPATPVAAGYLQQFLDADRRTELKAVLQRLFADPALVTRELVEETLRHKRIETVAAALRRIAEAATTAAPAALPPGLPVTIIAGSEDQVCPLPPDYTAPAGARFHRLPGVGHLPQLEATGAVIGLLEAALAG